LVFQWNQVGQGLARARARLDQEMFTPPEGPIDPAGHIVLALAVLPAHRLYGNVEQAQGLRLSLSHAG